MSNLAQINLDSFSVEIEKTPTIFIQKVNKIIVRHHLGRVLMFIDGKVQSLSSLVAHDVGLSIMLSEKDPDEMLVFIINGERIELLWPTAIKVATGLLRKADDADDWQILNRRKK